MSAIVGTIVSSIVPTFLIIAVGFILSRIQDIDVGPLNTLTLFVLTPALIVHSITLTELAVDTLLKISFGVGLFVAGVLVASWLIGVGSGKKGPQLHAFQLTAAFGNTGALGIPLADFAFGEIGRQTAVLFAAVHGVAVFTIGLYIAANFGEKSGYGSFKQVLRYPLVYAVLIAVPLRFLDLVPPADSAIMETLGLVGESSIPVMLIVLGIQLSDTRYQSAVAETVSPMAFRFIVSPIIGLLVAFGLGFQNSSVAQVFVLLTAMPVAVAPVIFATEFAGETTIGDVTIPEFVSASVFVSTLVSIPVLAVVVTVLELGILF